MLSEQYRFTSDLPRIFRFMLMMFFAVFPRLLLSPLLLRISADLGVSYDKASLFFLSASLGFSSGLILSGFIAHRITHHWTIIAGGTLTSISLLSLSLVDNYYVFHLFMVFLGFSNGLYHGSGLSSVTRIVPNKYRVRALSFHETAPNTAFILAPLLAALLAPHIGWQGVFILTGIGGLIGTLAFALGDKGANEKGEEPLLKNIKLFAGVPAYWVLLFLFAVSVSLALGVFSVLPTYLEVSHGLSERFLNTLVGASRITGYAAILLSGYLADRFGYRIVIGFILLFTGLLTILIGTLSGVLLLIAVFLQPMLTLSFFPAALGGITQIARPAARSLAVSLAIPLSNLIGAGLAPTLIGAAGAAGHFSLGFIVLGTIGICSTAFIFFLPHTIEEGK